MNTLLMIAMLSIFSSPISDTTKYRAEYQSQQLKIFANETELFATIKLKGSRESRLEQNEVGRFFYVAFSESGDPTYTFNGLIDRMNNSWLIKNESPDNILPNADFIGISDNEKYFLFEGGTGAAIRGFQVCNRSGNILFENQRPL